jgi:glycosyltransferase involved in cell wall biosynthesis
VNTSQQRKTIIYLVSEDWYFCSHRLPIARKALAEGFRVVVITKVNKHKKIIESEGFELAPIEIKRGGMNLFSELKTISELYSYYKKYNPDIVHHVAIKPVIYGTLVARFIGSIKIVNAMAGLGFIFISNKKRVKLLRFFVRQLFRFLFRSKNGRLILQNKDDLNYFLENKIVKKDQVAIIRGSGVNIEQFTFINEAKDVLIVMLASRMLWDKGVGEFVSASKILKDKKINARFVLVGENDPENPSSIPQEKLDEWHESGVIEYWGEQTKMHKVLPKASIICLPSYREGLPKVLLEAASCGRPIIATDVPGCREIVHNGENGILVPLKNSNSLASAMKELINNPEKRKIMGTNGRRLVESEFSEEIVVYQTLKVYQELLA